MSKQTLPQRIRAFIYFILHFGNYFLNAKNTPQIIVLSYHSISENTWQYGVSFTEFQKQIEFLSQDYQFITLDDLYAFLSGKSNLTKPSVVITFDDGYKDILITKSYLEKNHIQPALFVLSNRENANRKELDNNFSLLNETEILSLYKAGWTIGSHTAMHADLSQSIMKQLETEIIGSKKSLEKELGIPIYYFTYPKGIYTKNAVALTKQAGYKMALSVDDATITKHINKYIIPRITIDRTHTLQEFPYMISPASILFRQFLKKSGLSRMVG